MRTFLLPLTLPLLAASAAGQCEIAQPDTGTWVTWMSGTAFASGLAAVAGNANHVALFEPTAAGWTQTESLTIPGLVLLESPRVWTDGERVIVGMLEDGPTLNAQGRVYVFERAKNWLQPTMIESPNGQGFETFGMGLDAEGDTLVVGASWTVSDVLCGPGEVHFFEFDGTTWQFQAEFSPHGQQQNMGGFGMQVALDGDTAVAGAGWDDEFVKFAGAVYV
ncbi:MAG TPA: FG-GAP repeat protein, partial [Planctomycetota bacterium]|nr:FG-GAP repeat protein [Planctomycetota bacterium]